MTSLTPLLSIFTPEQIGYLSRYGEAVAFGENDYVITQGNENSHLYLVLTGSLAATRQTDDGFVRIGTIGPGHTIGEVSLFDPGPASATVQAKEETETWRICEERLEVFREEHPMLAYDLVIRIAKSLSERLRNSNDRYINSLATSQAKQSVEIGGASSTPPPLDDGAPAPPTLDSPLLEGAVV